MNVVKKTERSDEEKKQLLSRVNGQLDGIRKMIVENKCCNDVVVKKVNVHVMRTVIVDVKKIILNVNVLSKNKIYA